MIKNCICVTLSTTRILKWNFETFELENINPHFIRVCVIVGRVLIELDLTELVSVPVSILVYHILPKKNVNFQNLSKFHKFRRCQKLYNYYLKSQCNFFGNYINYQNVKLSLTLSFCQISNTIKVHFKQRIWNQKLGEREILKDFATLFKVFDMKIFFTYKDSKNYQFYFDSNKY